MRGREGARRNHAKPVIPGGFKPHTTRDRLSEPTVRPVSSPELTDWQHFHCSRHCKTVGVAKEKPGKVRGGWGGEWWGGGGREVGG